MLSSVLLTSAFALGAFSQTTTENIFLGAEPSGNVWAASVISADASRTTYAIACESGTGDWCASSYTFPVTVGSSYWGISSATKSGNEAVTVNEYCDLHGTTSADCHVSATVSVDGSQTATSEDTTLTGTDMNFFQIPITAGADKLAAASTATGSPNAAAAAGSQAVFGGSLKVMGVGAAMVGAVAVFL